MEFNKLCFVSDLHITTSAPFRVGDPLSDVLSKLEYVIEYANARDALILMGGDIFDKPTIPYEAYTRVCSVLSKAKYTPLAIKGNHDQLFRCDDNDKKTTLYNAFSIGVLKELNGTVDLGSCYVTSDKCLVNRDKPQILVFHGFLNTKDGKHTLYADDLTGVTTPTLVLLGHDHVEYEPVTIGACTVYRIGSLFRNRRVETSDRNPKMLFIEVSGNDFNTELVSVPCKSVLEIFRETSGKADKSEDSDYTELISELSKINGEDIDFMSIINKVANPQVADYIGGMLSAAKVKNVH